MPLFSCDTNSCPTKFNIDHSFDTSGNHRLMIFSMSHAAPWCVVMGNDTPNNLTKLTILACKKAQKSRYIKANSKGKS